MTGYLFNCGNEVLSLDSRPFVCDCSGQLLVLYIYVLKQ